MTLADILGDCYRRFNFQASPDATVVARFTAFVNETQREILAENGMSQLLYGTITFASVANQAEYGLPPSIARVLSVRDVANQRSLRRNSESWYRSYFPDPSAETGTPDWYVPLGYQAVALRPSDASDVFIKSTSASDTQVAYWEVVTSTGATRIGQVTLTGTTGVSISGGTITDIVQIVDLYLSTGAAGTVTIHEDSASGTQLGSVNIGMTRNRLWQMALVPTPSSVLTYTLDCEREVTDMVQGQDEPLLPPRFHALLAIGCRKKEYETRDDSERLIIANNDYEHMLGQLRAYIGSPPDRDVVPGGKRVGWSQLGPWFPADRWWGAS